MSGWYSGCVASTPPELVLRSAFERLICDEDVSGDGIETPKVVLVAAGDATRDLL